MSAATLAQTPVNALADRITLDMLRVVADLRLAHFVRSIRRAGRCTASHRPPITRQSRVTISRSPSRRSSRACPPFDVSVRA